MQLRSTRDRDEDFTAKVRDRVASLTAPPSGWVPHVPADAPPMGQAQRDPNAVRSNIAYHGRLWAAVADRLPVQLRLLELTRGHVAVLAAMCLAALALTAVFLIAGRSQALIVPLRNTPTAAATPEVAASGQSAPSSPSVSPSSPGVVVVHVSGLVQKPGLVQLPAGSRVDDALRAAGGAVAGADLSGLNLARLVTDGEQIAVSVPPAPDASPAGGASPDETAGEDRTEPVDLNRATLQELDSLPGVGPVLAQRILDWRAEHGRFTSIEELQEVKGIGERTFAELSEHVRV
jgi:competence protein ComEA